MRHKMSKYSNLGYFCKKKNFLGEKGKTTVQKKSNYLFIYFFSFLPTKLDIFFKNKQSLEHVKKRFREQLFFFGYFYFYFDDF